MPATSKFKIPFKENYVRPPANQPAIGGAALMQPNGKENSRPVTQELSVDCRPPYQIIMVERHNYSMIKYTKMVTNVTFK